MHLRNPLADQREMAVRVAQARVDARDSPGEPTAVIGRHHQVVNTLQEEDGHRDIGRLEAPRLHEGEVVVAPAVDALGEAALAGPDVLESLLRAEAAEMLATTPEQLRAVLLSVLSQVDQEALTGEFAAYLHATTERGLAERVDGWRDDDLAFTQPWGFEPADVAVPVLLLQGVHDLMVPPDHGRWLAQRIPGVEARVSDSDGHLTLISERVPEVHEWLERQF